MDRSNWKIGYTTGVFDMFHIGHLNLIKSAKSHCDYLIVGVSTDGLVKKYKDKVPVIPFEERMAIVGAITYVDKVVPQNSMNKISAWETEQFNVMFVGDDWKGTDKWIKYERQFNEVGVEIVYLPYTKHTSSTLLRELVTKKLTAFI